MSSLGRPWKVWCGFAVCTAVGLGVLAGLTAVVLRLEADGRDAAQRAQLEERVRLALWRMDSRLAPWLVEESARSAEDYGPLRPDRTADPRLRHAAEGGSGSGQGPAIQVDVGAGLSALPPAGQPSAWVMLHFQVAPDGTVTSPQVPAEGGTGKETGKGTESAVGKDAGRIGDWDRRLAALRARLEAAARAGSRSGLAPGWGVSPGSSEDADASGNLWELMARDTPEVIAAEVTQVTAPGPSVTGAAGLAVAPGGDPQGYLNRAEQQARANVLLQSQAMLANNRLILAAEAAPDSARGVVRLGAFAAKWVGDSLVMTRRVRSHDDEWLQGCWWDEAALSRELTALVSDLLPNSELRPALAAGDAGSGESTRSLVLLPLELVPGAIPSSEPTRWTAVRLALVTAWSALIVAVAAVAGLLAGTLALSERRAAFVAAVTHELRTPLTTFRMYSEMLAEGMIAGESTRQTYLATLKREAQRLSILVENVLAYARLERGRKSPAVAAVPIEALLAQVEPRLRERAIECGLRWELKASEEARRAWVTTDPAVVDQILFNLVDNACRHAGASSGGSLVRLEVAAAPAWVIAALADDGPGIPLRLRRRLFQPFEKGQGPGAVAGGIGLGLALSRRWIRDLGGDLRVGSGNGEDRGTRMELRLPRVRGTAEGEFLARSVGPDGAGDGGVTPERAPP